MGATQPPGPPVSEGSWPHPPPPPPPQFEAGPERGRDRTIAIVVGVALLAASFAVVFVVASRDDEPAASGAPTVLAPVPAGWSSHHLTDEGFRIGLPPGWSDASSIDTKDALEAVRRGNPELARVLDEQLAPTDDQVVRFRAFDTRAPTLAGGVATVLNVVVDSVGSGFSLDRYVNANLTTMRALPGLTIEVANRDVRLPGGRAALIRTRYSFDSPQGTIELVSTQYFMLDGDRGLVLSMSTTPGYESTYAKLFEQIANTFQPL